MKLAIYGSRRQDAFLKEIEEFLNLLASRGDEVVMHSKLYQYLLHAMPRALACVKRVTDTSDFSAEFAVSIGGDGTFLRTSAWVGDKQIPVIGVNTGHLGFLASLSINELKTLPEQLASGAHTIESRSVIVAEGEALPHPLYALNEVTLTRAETASIISVRAHIDGVELANYRADGLIIATPTGSTAYNLSVGGPIVQPSAPVFVVSPIAAHSLSMRPLVVSDNSVLELEVESRSPRFRLSADAHAVVLEVGTKLTVRKHTSEVKVVRLPGCNFANTLRNKLMWG